MQKKGLHNLSQLRQALRHLLQELEHSLEVAFGRSPLVKGNVYEIARKCGKPRLFSIPPQRLGELKEKSQEYLQFRRARARVTEIGRQIVAVLDQIENLRREEP
jgi:hypothetical protein